MAKTKKKMIRVPECIDRDGPHDSCQTSFLQAAKNGNVETMMTFLEKSCIGLDFKETALSQAAQNGHVRVVKLLLHHGQGNVDPNSMDDDGRTPLSRAAERGHTQVVELLTKDNRVNPDLKDKNGRTPLLWAIENLSSSFSQHVASIELLLQHITEPDSRDNMGRTALSQAAQQGHVGVVKLLLHHGQGNVDPNSMDVDGRTPLSRAAERGYTQVVELLTKDNRVNPDLWDKKGRTPLSWAIIGANYGRSLGRWPSTACEVVKLLLNRDNVNPESRDKEGRTPLSWAVETPGQAYGICHLLLKANTASLESMDDYGRTPLSRAAGSGDVRVMAELLQQNNVNPDFKDEDGRTPLSHAAGNGQEEMTKHLLAKSSVDPDSKDKHGRTPLWWAAAAGHIKCTRLLLANDEVDPGSMDVDGWTPLSCAVENGHRPTTREFIRKDRVTLNMLVMKGYLTHLQMLFENGHLVNTKCIRGRTPLHAAALSGYANITEELLRRKAIVDCKDNSGTTPLQLAIQHKHQEIIRLLLENSAETTGILPIHWLDAYNREASDVLELSQTLCGKKSVRFSQGRPLQISKLTRRMSLFTDYSMWSKYSTWNLNNSLPSSPDNYFSHDSSQMSYEIQGSKNHMSISVVGSYPTEQEDYCEEQPAEIHWGKCAIAWTMVRSSKSQDWESMDHFSMLSHCWFPKDGVNFFALFVQQLRNNWLVFCASAEERLSQRRLHQLCTKGNSTKLIHSLAEDAQEWAKLRKALRGQVLAITGFISDYYRCCEQANEKSIELPIDQFDTDVNKMIDQLDQTVKDLLQFEFAWVSINEAHRSTSIATSMKRLSWVTFVFLPAMFTSSLFGMNVDILQSNPDWRWYLLFSGGCLILTVCVWLLFRHGEIKRRIEKYPSSPFHRWPKGLTDGSLRLKTDPRILPI